MRLAAALVLAPAVAFAQAPGMYDTGRPLAPPGMTPPEHDRDAPAQATPAQPSGLEAVAARDAAADRAYGTSTAIALPSGKVDLSGRASYFGAMGSVAAGLGGGLEISADIGAVTDDVASVGGGLKLVVTHSRTASLAATASYHHMSDDCYDCSSAGALWAVGGVVSTCVGETCSSLLSAGGGVMGMTDGDNTIAYVSASLIAGTGKFRPIVEGAAMLAQGGGVLGFVGARMGGKRVAFDGGVGFLLPADGEGDGGAAAPMVGLSISP
jgi:hypothetical protein